MKLPSQNDPINIRTNSCLPTRSLSRPLNEFKHPGHVLSEAESHIIAIDVEMRADGKCLDDDVVLLLCWVRQTVHAAGLVLKLPVSAVVHQVNMAYADIN